MKFAFLITYVLALLWGLFSIPSILAQSEAASAARDYSFTISTEQPWTDSGVDLQAGELLEITSGPTQGANVASGNTSKGCDPRGISGSAKETTRLPVATAPNTALIAKFKDQGEAVLVGNSRQVEVDAPGHLFFGVNAQGTPACAGSFSVKVHLIGSESAQQVGVAKTAAMPPPQATGSSAQARVPKQDIKTKLANAAQVFLAGQFGSDTTATSSSSSAASTSAEPTSKDVASPNTTTTTAALVPALSVSNATLDPALQKEVDGLPRRVSDEFNNPGDMVNFVLIGSEQQVQSALEAASWHIADTDTKVAALKAVLETYQKKDYLQMPMSQLYLFGRKQDYGYEQTEAYSIVANRHHFRIWKAPCTWNGQTEWAGAGTHDIGFEKDQRTGKVTHKIDPAVDSERDNIGQTLQKSGKTKTLSYYLPPDPVHDAKNATGGGYHSDGRILVIVVQ